MYFITKQNVHRAINYVPPRVDYLCPRGGLQYFVTLISRSMAEPGFLSGPSDLHRSCEMQTKIQHCKLYFIASCCITLPDFMSQGLCLTPALPALYLILPHSVSRLPLVLTFAERLSFSAQLEAFLKINTSCPSPLRFNILLLRPLRQLAKAWGGGQEQSIPLNVQPLHLNTPNIT